MDDETYDFLKKLNPGKLVPIRTLDFEDQQIKDVKNEPGRSYLGTIKPSFILYVLQNNPELDFITYVDADIFFFSSLSPILNKLGTGEYNILLTPHRFPPGKEYLEKRNGIFNAGLACFKNNEVGLSCLKNWREQCLLSCENNPEGGRYGDQQYMDEWPKVYPNVCVFDDKGANVGPWNVKQYKISKIEKQLRVDESPLIFYHYSSLRIYSLNDFLLFDYSYKLSGHIRKLIYRPYTTELAKQVTQTKLFDPAFVPRFDIKPTFWENLHGHLKYDIVKLHIRLKEKVPLYSDIFYKYLRRVR